MKRLIEIQNKLKVPKGNFNSFGKYKYRSAEDILEAVKPLLAEQGLSMIISDDVFVIPNGWVYIKATVRIYDDENTLIAENSAFARESETKKGMDASQITGTASSYARKYCLGGMLLVDDTKDADTDEYHEQTSERVPAMSELKGLFDTSLTAKEKKDTLEHYGVSELKDLSDDQKIQLATALAKKQRAKNNEK